MLDAVAPAETRAAVCTIYDPNYPDPRLQRLATAALPAFNDLILRAAGARGLPVIDLRALFDAPADYANPIEPLPGRRGEDRGRRSPDRDDP